MDSRRGAESETPQRVGGEGVAPRAGTQGGQGPGAVLSGVSRSPYALIMCPASPYTDSRKVSVTHIRTVPASPGPLASTRPQTLKSTADIPWPLGDVLCPESPHLARLQAGFGA